MKTISITIKDNRTIRSRDILKVEEENFTTKLEALIRVKTVHIINDPNLKIYIEVKESD